MFLTTPKVSTYHKDSSFSNKTDLNSVADEPFIGTNSSINTETRLNLNSKLKRQQTVHIGCPVKRVSVSKVDDSSAYNARKQIRQYSYNVQASSRQLLSSQQLFAKPNRQLSSFAAKMISSTFHGSSSSKNTVLPGKTVLTTKGEELQQKKWAKVMELYSMRSELHKVYGNSSGGRNIGLDHQTKRKGKHSIAPSGQFYRLISQDKVFQREWKINLPQTFYLDSNSNIFMVYTEARTGILRKKIMQKENKDKNKYKEQILGFKDTFLEEVEENKKQLLINSLNFDQNPNIPLAIIKYSEDRSYQFETDVQTHRNFIERNLKPTRDSIVQRYVYSNNLKAMVFRLFYRKHNPSFHHRPQFQGIRFENQKPIFRESNTNYPEIHKLTSTLTISETRPNTIKYHKINNYKALEKFAEQTLELKKMLEFTENVAIDNLYVDFVVDIFDRPWIVNIKYCQINVNSLIYVEPKEDQINNVSSCRLCGLVAKKECLKNTVSIRLLGQFISHLKKRTKIQDEDKIDFIHSVNINSKENKMSNVCKVCYKVIIHELQLIKIEEELAKICNIQTKQSSHPDQQISESAQSKPTPAQQYKQWRLMLYFQDIKHLNQYSSTTGLSSGGSSGGLFKSGLGQRPNNYNLSGIPMAQSIVQSGFYQGSQSEFARPCNNNGDGSCPYVLKYQLSPKISESFRCKYTNSLSTDSAEVNQAKLHYFYSETNNIEDFIDNTEITVSLYRTDHVDAFSGSKLQGSSSLSSNLASSSSIKRPLKRQALVKRGQDYSSSSKSKPPTQTNSPFNPYSQVKPVASGSTHVLSSFNLFKSSSFSLKGFMQNGQRQTATVLLFFQNKKYCELTLKVGLVYDGSYNVSNIPAKKSSNANRDISSNFIKMNNIWFRKGFCNSNPLPKEWMQIFGSRYSYDDSKNNFLSSKISPQQEDQQKEQLPKKLLDEDEDTVENIMMYGDAEAIKQEQDENREFDRFLQRPNFGNYQGKNSYGLRSCM